MGKMVFLMPLAEEYIEKIKQVAPGWQIFFGKEESAWLPHLQDAEIIGGWNKQAQQLCLEPGAKSGLRWIHNWGAGVNQFPFAELKKRGIFLTNSSGVHAYPISESIFAMLLAFTRKLHIYVRNQQQKKWHHAHLSQELHGKTIGIVGVGAIGEETARLAKAFGMRVLGLRRSGEPAEHVDQMYDSQGLHELLRLSDYVVVTVPLTQETRYMFGQEQFAVMKPSAFFINIGRGETTDTQALMDALSRGQIAGAGLDVFETEPLPADSPLWEMENVIITPHTSGSTENYNERVMDIFLPNLRAYLQDEEPLLNRVDLDRQY